MASFHEGYTKFCSGKGVTQELRPLLSCVYNQIHANPTDLKLLKKSLVELMSFLSKSENRTDANCHAVDQFFCIGDHWNTRWDNLPEEYQLI